MNHKILGLAGFLFVIFRVAEGGPLVLSGRAVSSDHVGIDNVRVVVFKSGEDTTKNGGFYSIPLDGTIQGGDLVIVSVSPSTWIINNYFDGHVYVPKNGNDPVDLVLEKRGSRALLSNGRIKHTLEVGASRELPSSGAAFTGGAAQSLNSSIGEEAVKLGLSPKDFTDAIEKWITDESAKTEHSQALAAFYRKDFASATRKISDSIEKQETSLISSYVLLGNAQLNLINLRAAAAAYDKALGSDSNSADGLAGLTVTCTFANALSALDSSILDDEHLKQCESNTIGIARRAIMAARLRPDADFQSTVHTLAIVSGKFWVDAVKGPDIFEDHDSVKRLAADLRSAASTALSDRPVVSEEETVHQLTELAFIFASLLASNNDSDTSLLFRCIDNARASGAKAFGTDYPLKPILTALSAVDPHLSDGQRHDLYMTAIQSSISQHLYSQAAFLEWQFAEILVHGNRPADARPHYRQSLELWERAGTRQRLEPIVARIRYAMDLGNEKAELVELDAALQQAKAFLPPNHIVVVKLSEFLKNIRASKGK